MKNRLGKRSVIAGVVAATAAAIAVPLAVMSGGAGSAAPGGYVQGIEVHGDWTIEVRSPGGRLLRRARFTNALVPQGAGFLVDVLTGQRTPGPWSIALAGSDANDPQKSGQDEPCQTAGKSPYSCFITEPGSLLGGNQVFKNLKRGLGTNQLSFVGVAKAQRPGSIKAVHTWASSCHFSVAPRECLGGGKHFSFTRKSIKRIPVQPGQQISVTVKISFT